MKLDSENLDVETTENGEVVIEPDYLGFIRTQGFIIEEIKDARVVPSDSSESGHIVVQIKTYDYPRNHPELDYAAHEREITVCDCWSWRNSSNDVRENEKPGGDGCKHCRTAFKAIQAREDENQTELGK